MPKQKAYLQELSCQPPPSAVQGAGMVRAGDYLFFFGGHINQQFTKMYCGHIKRKQWFIFYVSPDGESTSIPDRKMSDEGYFLLPDISDLACAYVPENRQIWLSLATLIRHQCLYSWFQLEMRFQNLT